MISIPAGKRQLIVYKPPISDIRNPCCRCWEMQHTAHSTHTRHTTPHTTHDCTAVHIHRRWDSRVFLSFSHSFVMLPAASTAITPLLYQLRGRI